MKKFLAVALSGLMITTVVGCSSKDGGVENKPEINVEENVSVDNMKYFGKVKEVVGNEVELEIASREVLGMVDEDSEEAESDEPIAAVGMTPATPGDAPSNEEVVSGDANEEKMKLEYTGEVESVIIPGGVAVVDLRTGKDGKISDIKDGSVVIVYTDSTSESISKIEIVE